MSSSPDGENPIKINESSPALSCQFEDMSLFYCPHCQELLTDPVVGICGHSFCAKCYPNVTKCSLDDQSLSSMPHFSPPLNSILISIMNRVMSPCRFHCGQQIPIVKLKDHFDSCPAMRRTQSARNLMNAALKRSSNNTVPGEV